MPKIDLTDRFCSTIKTATKVDYFDAKTTGLALRVAPSGVKTWAIQYTSPVTRKSARLILGHYPATSLAAARGRAIEARSHVEAGVDPRNIGKVTGAMTVIDLMEFYIASKVKTFRRAKDTEQRLRREVTLIGHVKLSELHRRDAHRVLDRIVERGAPKSATRVLADMRTMVRWGVERGYLDHDPFDAMKAPTKYEPRTRVLEDDEISALWHAWRGSLGEQFDLVLKLCLVTGQRSGEVAGMMYSELDLQKRLWTIPAERSKNKHEHRVPLSDLAVELIREALAGARDDRVFRVSQNFTARRVCDRRHKLPVQDWTTHDLRRTACTKMVELGVSPLIVGHVANHRGTTKSGITLGVYVQYDYAVEKRQALDLWADRLAGIVGAGAKVLPLRERLQ